MAFSYVNHIGDGLPTSHLCILLPSPLSILLDSQLQQLMNFLCGRTFRRILRNCLPGRQSVYAIGSQRYADRGDRQAMFLQSFLGIVWKRFVSWSNTAQDEHGRRALSEIDNINRGRYRL